MRSRSRALRGSAAVVLVLLAAGAWLSGCSSVGSPEEGMTQMTGGLTGRVTTDAGGVAVGVSMTLWTEAVSGGSAHTYTTTTDQNGDYEFTDVMIEGAGVTEMTYDLYVNRTRSQATGIVEQYSSYAAEVTIEGNETVTMDVELALNPGGGEPEPMDLD